MIRNLLATTAIATLVATGAFAQEATTPAPAPAEPAAPMTQEAAPAAPVVKADGHLATQIIGESVYNGTGEEAQNVGDVNDIVVGADGKIEAVIVGVGGFLGIGEKDVAVDFAQLDWAERDGDRWLVAPMTKEQLETQAAFDRSAYLPEQPVAANDPAASTTTPPAAVAPADPAAPAPDATAEAPPRQLLTRRPRLRRSLLLPTRWRRRRLRLILPPRRLTLRPTPRPRRRSTSRR